MPEFSHEYLQQQFNLDIVSNRYGQVFQATASGEFVCSFNIHNLIQNALDKKLSKREQEILGLACLLMIKK